MEHETVEVTSGIVYCDPCLKYSRPLSIRRRCSVVLFPVLVGRRSAALTRLQHPTSTQSLFVLLPSASLFGCVSLRGQLERAEHVSFDAVANHSTNEWSGKSIESL